MKQLFVALFSLGIFLLTACNKVDDNYGYVSIQFVHEVDGSLLALDTMQYQNEAGNYFSVTDLKYFISDFTLIRSDGSKITLSEDSKIHYIDHKDEETMMWQLPDSIPVGVYKSISFTFGLDEATNHSGLFPTPPESNMEWPTNLGGGYQYMKMDGCYASYTEGMHTPYQFYLGIGQIHPSQGLGADEVTYVQNYFTVTLNDIQFELDKSEEVVINLFMEIENWMQTPNEWDFYSVGAAIATNQEAQFMAKENGNNVFSACIEESRDEPRESH